MSWLTDPDEEWSPETEPGRSGRHESAETAAANARAGSGAGPAHSGFPDYQGDWGGGPVEPVEPPGPAGPDSYVDRDDRPSRLKIAGIIVTGWLVVSAAVLLFLLLIQGPHKNTGSVADPTSSAAAPTDTNSASSSLPDGWVQQTTDDQTNCAMHAYGQVQAFLAKTPCSSVHRVLSTTNVGGRPVVVASYTITFNSAAQANSYNALVASDGTGNISDLLREGTTYPGAPGKLPPAGFASRVDGVQVQVAEAGYAAGASSSADPTLQGLAQQAVAKR
ncbi:hypothetical protein ACSMXN_00615 [Jatrophihabitans sp. DSM 45814]